MNKNTQGKPSGKPVRRDGVDPVLRSRARRRAVQAIYAWQISGGNAQSLIAQFAHEQAREIADLAYFEALLHGDAPGPLDLGHQRDHGHDRAVEFAARKPDVDALRRVEPDPFPEHGVDLHADELEAVLVQFERHDHEPGREEHEEPDDEGKFCAGEPHQQLVGQELAAAGEIARVALDFSACGMVGQRDRPAVGADVVTRHGIAPGACRRWR